MQIRCSSLRPGLLLRGLILTACLWVFVVSLAQQFPVGMSFKNFSLPENYGPPNETQMKSLLQGADALPQKDDRILIKQLKLSTFREDGGGEFVMEADDCLYDSKRHTAQSSGPLELKTVDGRFATTGQGFLWRENESTLYISNRVHTVIHTGGVITTNTP